MKKLYRVVYAKWASVVVEAESETEAEMFAEEVEDTETLDKKGRIDGWCIEFVEEVE